MAMGHLTPTGTLASPTVNGNTGAFNGNHNADSTSGNYNLGAFNGNNNGGS